MRWPLLILCVLAGGVWYAYQTWPGSWRVLERDVAGLGGQMRVYHIRPPRFPRPLWVTQLPWLARFWPEFEGTPDRVDITLTRDEFDDDWLLAHQRHLRSARRLQLVLTNHVVTDRGLAGLRNSSSVVVLQVDSPRISADGVSGLGVLPNCVDVTLTNAELSPDAFASLARWPQLRFLTANGRSRGWSALAMCKKLEGLSIVDATDGGLAELDPSLNAKILALTGPGVTDDCVPQLLKLKSLATLRLRNTRITQTGADRLRAAGLDVDAWGLASSDGD